MALTYPGGGYLKHPVRANETLNKSGQHERRHSGAGQNPFLSGFTLIELLVVMAIIATLLTLAVPRYFGSIEKSKEAVLKQDLTTLRDSLDKYYGDTGRYPDLLEDLVTKKYLRSIPVDPITESNATWVLIAPENPGKGLAYDVKSGAPGKARDGTSYGDW